MDRSQIDQLIDSFKSYQPLNEAEKAELESRVKLKRLRRRQFILQEGDVCKHHNFVLQGCLKMYHVDDKGNEHILQFAAEDTWITDLQSFYSGKPGRLYIEALEPTTVFQITKPDLLFFFVNYPKFDRNFRVIIEDQFIRLQDRVLQNISSTAQQRYLNFLQQYPGLAARLPNTQIAAFLGITPEFLSKVRKEIVSG